MKTHRSIGLKAILTGIGILGVVSCAQAQQQPTLGSMFKTAAAGAGKAVAAQLCPQAQQTVDQAKKLSAVPAQQQNFIVTKAKEYLAAKNYQPAYDLANYVMTIDPKSVDAKKIMTDAKVALTKIAQEQMGLTQQKVAPAQGKATQVQADANKTAEGVKGLLGAFGSTK